jgi:prepilin-type N-terminal cleavage/methylation domain-containing protein
MLASAQYRATLGALPAGHNAAEKRLLRQRREQEPKEVSSPHLDPRIETGMETRQIQPHQAQLQWQRRAENARGFSMVELMLVAAIAVILIAIALPNMTTSMTLAKWRGEISDLSGVFQSCRSQAVKNNHTEQLTFTTNNGTPTGLAVAFIFNLDNPIVNGVDTSHLETGHDTESMLAAQRQVWMFSQFSQVDAPTGANPPPLTKGMMWGGSDTTLPATPSPSTPATNNVCFNSRGIPCNCPATIPNYCTAITNGYAFYFQQNSQWAAVGVSPAGRIKTYFWDGQAWAN